MLKSKIQVELTVVPTSGKPSTKTVKVAATGAKVSEVLAEAGVSPEGKDLYLNDEPASLDTHVQSGQKLSAESREENAAAPPPQVRAEERPAGS